MRVLVIGAHPDDEILGCGATIAKHVDHGDEVYVLIVSEGVSSQYTDTEKFLKLRREGCLKAAKYLGIKKVFFYDFPDAKLDSISQIEINKTIEKVIEKVRPQRVYTPHWGDMHKDHRLVFESALVATRKKVKEVYCYEILGNMNKIGMAPFSPNYFVEIFKYLKKKLKALSFYSSEIKKFPKPFSKEAVVTLAKYRAVEAGLKAAEAFVCVKKIEI
jgi:LmbE family N-acetylglucosaminyl deacetylase